MYAYSFIINDYNGNYATSFERYFKYCIGEKVRAKID